MVPRFRGDNVWTPAFAGVTNHETFYEFINFDSVLLSSPTHYDSDHYLSFRKQICFLIGAKDELDFFNLFMLNDFHRGRRDADL
jgi:hypothetical protein